MEYIEFLQQKMALTKKSGFQVQPHEINFILYPHQRDIVQWALDGGRLASLEMCAY